MKRTVTILLFLIVLINLCGCVSKRYTKKAQKLENTGQYTESANLYYEALISKRTNVEAFAGLKRTGQMVLSKKLSEFNKAYNLQDNDEAIKYYQDAKAYYDKLNKLDIQLNFPSYYNDYYNEVKDVFLEDKYYDGVNLLDQEKFSEAEKVFNEIIKLQPNYKDSKDRLITAIYEPKYQQGLKYMEQEKFRQAYYVFKDIVDKTKSYKNSYDYQRESLEKGTVNIYISPVKNNSSYSDVKSSLENKISNLIQSQKNPFVKILASNSNADLTLQCEVTNYKYDEGRLKSTEQRGYLKKTVKIKNKETDQYENKTEYEKIMYTEYYMTRSINMTITYKLVNNRTNQIYKSDTKTVKAADEIKYAKYSGNSASLVPGYWENRSGTNSKDKINDTYSAVRQLQNLFSARTKIKDYSTLSSEVINSVSETIAKSVNNFVLEN
jgi:tetratricopeptide (TPR) repeat protein